MAKILVADDNSNIQKMVTLALKDLGIEVVSVGNGEAAVRKLPDVSPDLVLADIFMPVRNGYEVCEFVKQDARFANIPVILLVGAFDPLDETEVQRVGADGVLKKPFVPPEPLIAMVKSMLERSSGSSAEPVAVGTTRVASPAAASTSDAKPAPPSVEPPGPFPVTPAPASLEGETDEYIEPLRASPFAEPNLGYASASEEDTEPGTPRFPGAAIGDQLWEPYGEREKAGKDSVEVEKEVGPLEDLLSRRENAGLQPLELEHVEPQELTGEVVETEARATEAPEERQPTKLDHDAAIAASSEKRESDYSGDESTKPPSIEWRESWAAKEPGAWVEQSGGSAPVDKAPAAHEERSSEEVYPGIDLDKTLAAIRAAHGLRPSEPESVAEPPVPAEHAQGLERFVRQGIFGQAIPFEGQASGEVTEQTSEAGSAVPTEKPWPGVPEPPPLPIEEESRVTELEPEARRGAEPRTPAGWLDALSPGTPKAEPSTEPASVSGLVPVSMPTEPVSTYRPAPSETAPLEQGPAEPLEEPTNEAAIQAAVNKVIERMQGQMLDVVTREVLRPVVEALVRRELKKP